MPRPLKAIANGSLVKRVRRGQRSIWRWSAREPMAPYLATVATGRFRLRRGNEAGIRALSAIDPRLWPQSRAPLRKTGRILTLFQSLFGPYPFEVTGAIVDDAPTIGYALETQTRPVYDRRPHADADRPRARPSVVRRQRRAHHLARDLAQRGLCDLGAVALGRAGGWPDDRRAAGAAERDARERERVLEPAPGRDPGAR